MEARKTIEEPFSSSGRQQNSTPTTTAGASSVSVPPNATETPGISSRQFGGQRTRKRLTAEALCATTSVDNANESKILAKRARVKLTDEGVLEEVEHFDSDDDVTLVSDP
jgi:hypothetical protein